MKFKNLNIKSVKGMVLIVVVVSIFLYIASVNMRDTNKITDRKIKRPDYGSETKTEKLKILDDDGNLLTDMELSVMARQIPEEQLEEYFINEYEEILEAIKGENDSLSNVKKDLNLITVTPDKIMTIDWYSDNYKVLNYNGVVGNSGFDKGHYENVNLTAVIKYNEFSAEYNIPVRVCAKDLTEEQRYKADIVKEINNIESAGRENEYMELPEAIEGKSISYVYDDASDSPVIYLLLGIAAVFVIVFGNKQKKAEELKKRKKLLMYDYPELISKLTLLTGAGMTVRKAWEKIVLDYKKQRAEGGIKTRIVYEEMYETFCNMQAGISEVKAYEKFGRRCDTKEYMKLASLLGQNIKKGTKDISRMLEEEAKDAFELRKSMAKQKGEEAGTKLLIPMIIMLVIVMVIVMVPSMMNFQI